jgi:hypothetical protein
MEINNPVLNTAVQWHKEGRHVSPSAVSVKLTQEFIDEILEARVLILEQLKAGDLKHPWMARASSFVLRTNVVETVKHG